MRFPVVVAALLVVSSAHADDEKVAAFGASAAIVRAPALGIFETIVGVDGRVLLGPQLSVGGGWAYGSGEHHYERCGDPNQCHRNFHFARAFAEYHFRGGEVVVDPFVRLGGGLGFARTGWWNDREERTRPFVFVDARVGVSFVIAGTVAVGLHGSAAAYSMGYGYYSPLGAHLEVRF